MRPQRPRRGAWLAGSCLAAPLALALAAPAAGQALPAGASVSAGSAAIRAGAGGVTVSQSSSRAVIDWKSFSVGAGQSVTFVQPGSSSAILNRVNGPEVSSIAGSVSANGQVFLVNRNGVIVTPGGRVDAGGGFVASTLDISNADFMAGRLNFAGQGGAVVNQGTISSPGGAIALLGSSVSNSGLISAPLGKVAMGSGQQATLDFSGNGLLQVAIPADMALVSNSGRIVADGGVVVMRAATARQAVRQVVNMSGVIQARGVSGQDGAVNLDGGPGGDVTVSGAVDVSGPQTGGQVDVTGADVSLQGARITATGAERGGLVRIGGAFQGGQIPNGVAPDQLQLYVGRFGPLSPVAAAVTTSIDPTSMIDVSGGKVGGTAVVWSSGRTVQHGQIIATGQSGGAVEMSSRGVLDAAVSRARVGPGGVLLLDPQDIEVDDDVYFQNTSTTADTYSGPVNFSDNTGTTSYLDAASLQTLVQGGTDLVLKASNDLRWNASNFNAGLGTTVGNVSLYAGRSVSIGGYLTVGNANLTIVANDTAADGVVDADRLSAAGGVEALNGVLQAGIGSGTSPGKGNISITVSTGAGNTNNTPGPLRLGPIESDGGAVTISNSGQGLSAPIVLFPSAYGSPTAAASITASGAVTLTGPIEASTGLTVSGSSVTWTDEATSLIAGGAPISFVENGVTTRYGVPVGIPETGTPPDMTRVSLGAGGSYAITYGGANPSATAHITSGSGDLATALAGLNLSASFPAANSAAGSYSVTTSATINAGSVPAGYFYNLNTVTETLTINPKVLTPTVSNGSYVYGSPTAVVSLSGVINGDAVSPVVNLGATPTTLVANGGGFGFAAGTSAGSYSFTLTGLTGGGASNYVLSATPSGALTISPRPLTYTILDATSTYGTLAAPIVLLTGVVGSDDVAAGTIDATANGATAALAARTAAGSYTLTLASLSGTTAGDYSIASTGDTAGSLTVSPLAITYSATSATSTYGTLASVATPTLTGVLGGDDVSAQTLLGGQALTLTPTTAAGTYAITPQLTGAQAGDYVIASSGNTTGALTIARKAVTATLSDVTQTYGSQTAAVTLAGLVSGDESQVTPLFSDGSNFDALDQVSGATYAFPIRTAAGSRTVAWSTLLGTAGSNYTVSFTGGVSSLSLTVNPKTITYSIASSTQGYHVNGGAANVTFTGVLSGDDVSAPVVATITGTSTTVTFDPIALNAGTYDLSIAPGSLTGASAGDYVLAASGNTDGVRTVSPRTITYAEAGAASTYGTLASIPTPSLSFIDSGDSVSGVVSVELSGSPVSLTSKTPAGSYVLAVTSLTGAQSGNYVLASSGNTDGVLTIQPLTVTALVGSASSTYGTAATVSGITALSGALSGEDVSAVVSGCVINSNCALTFTPGAATAAGTYALRATGLTGAAAANYVLASSGNVDGSLVISPKTLTYTLGATSWVYGDSATSAATPTLNGVINGDLVSGVVQVKDSFNDYVTLQYGSPAGSYSETVTGLAGLNAGNYVLAASGNTGGTVTITRKPLQGFAFVNGASTVTYGTVTPGAAPIGGALQGVLSGDLVNAVLSTPTLPASGAGYLAAGTYSFTVSGLSGTAAANYSLSSSTTATLTISPKALSPGGLSNINSTYGTLATLQVPQLAGLLAGDQVSGGTYTVSAYGSSTPITLTATTPAGPYTVSIASLTGPDSGNYSAGSGSTTLIIAPKPLTYTAASVSSTYGTLAVIPAITLSGVVGSDSVQAPDNISSTLTATTAAGRYTYGVLNLTGTDSANYTIATSGNQQGVLTINPKTLTYSLTSNALTAIYGDAIANPLQLHGVVGGDDVSAPLLAEPTGSIGTLYQFGSSAFPDATTYKLVMQPLDASSYWLTGAQANNYVLPNDHLASLGTLTVSPRTITYATGVANATQVYGQTLGMTATIGNLTSAPFSFTYVANGPGGSARAIDNTTVNLSVGTYAIGVAPSGSSANDYVVAGAGNSAAEITITPKAITASYDNSAPVYGTPWVDMYSLPGLVAGDTVEPVVTINGKAVTLTPTSPGYGMSLVTYDVAPYQFTLSRLAGAQAGNYTLTNAGTQSSFGVQPKTITYSIAPETVEYGSFPLPLNPPATCDARCLTIQQPLTTGKVTFNGILPGDANRLGMSVLLSNGSLSFPYAVNTPVGAYSQLFDGLTGSAANDYVIAPTGNSSGTLTIVPVWVQANIAGGSRVYNGSLTGAYSILGNPGAATVSIGDAPSGVSYASVGFLPGDDVQVVVAVYNQDNTVYTKGEPIPVGTYWLEAVGFTGAQAANYRALPTLLYPAGYGSTRGEFDVVDSSLFQFNLLSSNPNQTGYYTPPAAVTTQPPASATQTSGSTTSATAGAGVTTTPISAKATAGASAGASTSTDLSSQTQLSADVNASTSATASFNPRGVTVSANAQGAVSVTLTTGPVSETLGADASASSSVSLVLLSSTPNVKVTELAQAGVSGTVSVDGSLGNGVSGSASNTNSVYVEARSQTQLSVQDGTLTLSENEFVGAGASTSVSGSVSGDGVTGSATVGVYSPGSLGLGASSTSGYSDGTLTIGFNLAVSVGIGGLDIAPSLSFPVGDVVSTFSSMFGGGPSYCDSACQAAALLKGKIGQAESLRAAGGNSSLAEMAFLSQNPDVVTALQQSNDPTEQSMAFQYQVYGDVPQRLSTLVSQEQALVKKIDSNPAQVTPGDIDEAQSLRYQESSLIGAIKNLGGQIQVQNGTMSIVQAP